MKEMYKGASTPEKNEIDLVIPWVNPNDVRWQEEKAKYRADKMEDSRNIRYRDWGNLKLVFRSIEKNLPWIRKVHFVTCGQIPDWMNTEYSKLHLVNHKDYIPSEYLPTFSSHVIEINMHRIPGLSEQFIYTNDDIFFLREAKPTEFFYQGLPCDINIPNLIVPSQKTFSPIVFKDVQYINKHFNKRIDIKNRLGQFLNPKYGALGLFSFLMFAHWKEYTGFFNHHLAVSYLKSTFEEIWRAETQVLQVTSSHKFRNDDDVNQYIFRYWQLAKGTFHPYKLGGEYFKISDNNSKIIRYLQKRKGRMVCINDDEFSGDFISVRDEINRALEELFPDKSRFEL